MIGFSIHPRRERVDAAWTERFRELPVANVSDVMSRMSGSSARIRPMHDGTPMAGAALTVRVRPGDNLMLHKALDMADPGDVVVVDAGGDLTNALFGGLMLQYAAHRGVAGILIDGAIRDSAEIRAQSLPVFAAGITHRGPYRDGPGSINVPVAIDGMVIEPGDLILADTDGVLSVPRRQVAEIYQLATAKQAAEAVSSARGKHGEFDREWVDRELERRGCKMFV